jgi:hypothetical protein
MRHPGRPWRTSGPPAGKFPIFYIHDLTYVARRCEKLMKQKGSNLEQPFGLRVRPAYTVGRRTYHVKFYDRML